MHDKGPMGRPHNSWGVGGLLPKGPTAWHILCVVVPNLFLTLFYIPYISRLAPPNQPYTAVSKLAAVTYCSSILASWVLGCACNLLMSPPCQAGACVF